MATKKAENREETVKNTCFVIMPFSDPEGYETGHFRSIYEHTFAPAIRAAGYDPLRIDDNIVSSLIHGKMMNELVTAPMVLCDLSTNNPNVLYELGIRHAFDLPVVLVQEIGQKRIFDIAGITSVEYHRSRLYEEVLEDQKKITEAILQTANAKTKYSIMSLVALHAAKPADSGMVTHEDRLEYLIQDMSHKMNILERRIVDMQHGGIEIKYGDNRDAARDDILNSLKKMISETEFYLDVSEMMSDYATIDETDEHGYGLERLCRECREAGVDRTYLERAEKLIYRLSKLRDDLENKERNSKRLQKITGSTGN